MKNYKELMEKIIREGYIKKGTLSLFGESLEFNLTQGFPLVTTRKINYKAAFAELACFLEGFTDVRQFNSMGVNFWDHDAYKKSWSENPAKKHEHDLGKIYGYQWKYGFGLDQVKKLVDDLKSNPHSRRHVLITFNPRDLGEMCLPPCYVSHQFYVEDDKLNMLVHQRSADYCIGVPFDIASFALFQSLMAKEVGLKPAKLKIIFGDVHIYEEHFNGVSHQLKREPGYLSFLKLEQNASIFNFRPEMATIGMYKPQESIKYPFQVQD